MRAAVTMSLILSSEIVWCLGANIARYPPIGLTYKPQRRRGIDGVDAQHFKRDKINQRRALAFCHYCNLSAQSFRKRTTKFNSKSHHAKSSSNLSMSLIPIPINELTEIIPVPSRLAPTGDQYLTYLGRTPSERFNTLFEGFGIAFLGSMFAYFISFVIGDFLATLLGIIFLFWPILSPEFKAYQRNWELIGGRDLVDVWMKDEGIFRGIPQDKRGLYGAYYVTNIRDVCVVDDVLAPAADEYDLAEFIGYKKEKDELEAITGIPWKLRLKLMDEEDRGMQIHCRMSEDYLDVQPGMDMIGVLLSTSTEFTELAGMSDFCVLDDEGPVAWVGDYPYLVKDVFLRTLDSNGVLDSIPLDHQEEFKYDMEIKEEWQDDKYRAR